MKNLNKRSIFFAALFFVVVQYLIIFPEKVGICELIKNPACVYGFWDSSLRDPLFDISLSLLISSALILFVRNDIFLTWRNFAFVWIPLSIIITAITPDASGSFQVIDKEFVAIIFSGLFVLISLILVAYKFFSLKKTRLGN